MSDEHWRAAHERLGASRALYLQSTGGVAYGGRPANGMDSPYLLTGQLTCGACGGTMFAHRHGHQDRNFFVCVCTNGLEANMANADHAVLGAVEHDLLRVDVLETALQKAMEMLLRPQKNMTKGREHDLRAELARLDTEVARLAGAIAAGGDLPALVSALQKREQRRSQVRAELARLERERAAGARNGFDAARVLDALRGKLTDWQGMLRQEPGPARRALRALLAGRLTFTPQEQDGQRFYRFEGTGTMTPVLAGIALPKAYGTPP